MSTTPYITTQKMFDDRMAELDRFDQWEDECKKRDEEFVRAERIAKNRAKYERESKRIQEILRAEEEASKPTDLELANLNARFDQWRLEVETSQAEFLDRIRKGWLVN